MFALFIIAQTCTYPLKPLCLYSSCIRNSARRQLPTSFRIEKTLPGERGSALRCLAAHTAAGSVPSPPAVSRIVHSGFGGARYLHLVQSQLPLINEEKSDNISEELPDH